MDTPTLLIVEYAYLFRFTIQVEDSEFVGK